MARRTAITGTSNTEVIHNTRKYIAENPEYESLGAPFFHVDNTNPEAETKQEIWYQEVKLKPGDNNE